MYVCTKAEISKEGCTADGMEGGTGAQTFLDSSHKATFAEQGCSSAMMLHLKKSATIPDGHDVCFQLLGWFSVGAP